MWLVYYVSMVTVGAAATDWANDGLFGDGYHLFGIGTGAYEEAAEEYGDTAAILEAYENGESTYIVVDDETMEASEPMEITPEVLAEANEMAAKYGEEGPDPADFGVWVPGIPALIGSGLEAIGCADWLSGLILDGIIAGVGAVLGFVPQMLVLFIFLAFLEACGYMARIAFILDRIFRRFGLSGKSFIPVLIGTGCGIPGIMACRTIENERDRRMTIMTKPLFLAVPRFRLLLLLPVLFLVVLPGLQPLLTLLVLQQSSVPELYLKRQSLLWEKLHRL